MSAPIISVIVPVFNSLTHLARCLDSICGQTFDAFEVLIVDDASTDGSSNWLDSYANCRGNMSVIHHARPLGVSAARNSGIAVAQGKYLAFVDSDDWAEPTMLETLYRAITSTDSQVAHIEHKSCIDEKAFLQPKREHVRVMSGTDAAVEMLEQEEYAVWSRLYETELVRELGDEPFPVNLTCEDRVFNMRVLPKAARAAASNRLEYHYATNLNSISFGGLSRRAMEILEADELMVSDASRTHCDKLIELALDRQAKGAYSMLVKQIRFGITDESLCGEEGKNVTESLRRRFIKDYPRLASSSLPLAKRVVAWQLRYIPGVVRAEFALYNFIAQRGRN